MYQYQLQQCRLVHSSPQLDSKQHVWYHAARTCNTCPLRCRSLKQRVGAGGQVLVQVQGSLRLDARLQPEADQMAGYEHRCSKGGSLIVACCGLRLIKRRQAAAAAAGGKLPLRARTLTTSSGFTISAETMEAPPAAMERCSRERGVGSAPCCAPMAARSFLPAAGFM